MRNIIIRLLSLCTAMALIATTGCNNEAESLNAEYGYVQFKLVKAASMDTRVTDALDRLADAHKVTVIMQHEGSTITQTLPLASYDAESAEWGLRSEKLRLMIGSYNVIGYHLYDNLDNVLLTGSSAGEFMVECGGLAVKEIGVECVKRGKVSFVLYKEFTRAGENLQLSNVKAADITVKNNFTRQTTTFEALTTTYCEAFVEGSMDKALYDRNGLTSYIVCSGEHWIEAGNYTITGYTLYSDSKAKSVIESQMIESLDAKFSVADNQLDNYAFVPILLSTTSERIKDYMALKEIWLALDGPNWTFYGEEYPAGANWDFNRDIDMWGEQPGVTLNAAGRVESLNISGFGANGIIPEAIGQLTDLKLLYLGNHNELIGGYNASTSRIEAHDYYDTHLKYDVREGLSPELQRAINSDATQRPILASRAEKRDVAFGNLTNGITGISRAVMRLTKLEQLFIANAPIASDNFWVEISDTSEYHAESKTWSWSTLTNLTDVEIYNCPNLTRLPIDLLTGLPRIQSLNVAMNLGISGEQLKSDWEAIIDGASGGMIEILYLGYNNLRETPSHDYMKRMSKLGLLDCTNNRLEVVHPFGKEVSPATILLDNNRITRLYAAEDGYFCGLSMMEDFSCSGNMLTELPDIFTARSVYTMVSANFSSNNISALEHGDNWRGINAASLNLADNNLEELPKALLGSGSIIGTLMLGSNGMRRIEEGALTGANSENLTTIDLSFNRLTELPYDDFSASNIPYLYGIDLSSNAFSNFPYAPLSIDRLTVLSIRQQRDDEGNRTLKEWPTGIGTCPRMSALYIGSNDLRKIEDTISPYILLFEIKDNPNISIDLSDVCPYIEMGYYELIYDSTQDIRGCDALNLD
ncbi:MAG: DUF4458 domain-containing protein [Alistipes sp.]|nr:DUF4458 domain-containing protein [Alistipes sp.]